MVGATVEGGLVPPNVQVQHPGKVLVVQSRVSVSVTRRRVD